MKSFQKFVSYLLVFILVFIFPITSLTFDVSSNSIRNTLLDMGVPSSFIENKEDCDLYVLFNKLNGRNFHFYDSETVYLNTSDYSGDVMPCGSLSEDDMTLTITKVDFTEYDSEVGMNFLEEVMVFIDYRWLKQNAPFVKKDDGISVNWDSNVFTYLPGSFSATDYYMASLGVWSAGPTNNNPYIITQGGLGYYADLGYVLDSITHKGTAFFSLVPRDPNTYKYANGNATNINVQYVHDKTPLVGSISFTVYGVGISINAPVMNDSAAKSIIYHYTIL